MSNSNYSDNFDSNIDNYNISELTTILDLDEDNLNEDDINSATDSYINNFNSQGNEEMSNFFMDVKNKLLDYNYLDDINDEQEKTQQNNWTENQTLQQTNTTQADKNTDRKQQVDVFNDNHLTMNRNQLGVSNSKDIPVAQGTMNPNLQNIMFRFMNLDSQFRSFSSNKEESSTDYTLNLSDTLSDTLSLKLYSFQIPYSWYVIDSAYGNTCFWLKTGVSTKNETITKISILPGNYSSTTFIEALNQSFTDVQITKIDDTEKIVTYNSANGKITMDFNDIKFIDNSYIITEEDCIIFFDTNNELNCDTNCSSSYKSITKTLGWVMGFRTILVPFTIISFDDGTTTIENITGSANLDLYGPRYLILSIDDYNQNHINNGLVSISENSTYLKTPTYDRPDLPYTCTTYNNETPIQYNNETPIQEIVPAEPRLLTQAQIYTINEIKKNNNQTSNYRTKAPTTTDVFALIPIKHNGLKTGDMITDYGNSLQLNKRTYFGPIDISRMRIRLYDDKGNLLNLNGVDWSITLISEILYQY
jgi:hypothetical protein